MKYNGISSLGFFYQETMKMFKQQVQSLSTWYSKRRLKFIIREWVQTKVWKLNYIQKNIPWNDGSYNNSFMNKRHYHKWIKCCWGFLRDKNIQTIIIILFLFWYQNLNLWITILILFLLFQIWYLLKNRSHHFPQFICKSIQKFITCLKFLIDWMKHGIIFLLLIWG